MYGSGLQSLVLAGSVLTSREEAITATTSLNLQQENVLALRTVRAIATDSGALYICRPEPWFL